MAFGSPSTRGVLIAAALMCAVAVPGVAAAQSQPLSVEIDQSARIQLRGQAGSVIVGNPAIADVTVVDADTLFVTGKGYGVTEVVVVDGLGRTLFQSQVVVAGGDTGRVRVWRGAQVTEMACASSCAPTLRSSSDAAATPAPSN
ncbi:pilus assembly protein N-terminal domain-containing protein [Brevundimonas sp.]|jgi:Flp pilus assembly secretin CpaC|uniref:pilus assembly protein N-terminal domain-containing protein n=1 Tax=Brevundimonas sp. TaxID=1871086 RepID=UPI002E12309C|nr:pilus assembly protein N-terminal domain-containing protein [Brevundimonas sp.]